MQCSCRVVRKRGPLSSIEPLSTDSSRPGSIYPGNQAKRGASASPHIKVPLEDLIGLDSATHFSNSNRLVRSPELYWRRHSVFETTRSPCRYSGHRLTRTSHPPPAPSPAARCSTTSPAQRPDPSLLSSRTTMLLTARRGACRRPRRLSVAN
jgi:hypothetical protein